ncbi:MAG: aminotransferase class V-fold PLP-dependent enzyme [Acidobacteria bacterium]|nr:aminotransferase class V-fold PLP-dependent enzyme [Acidobacteriota bacterium]MBI3427987.1 aminotransferase class V-fold PLP-dependent enzyme [Acidobacteriota bacterium]
MPEQPINRRREEFSTLASGIHLLSHSLGPMPRRAREAMQSYCDLWEQHTSEDAWAARWWELSEEVGNRLARILGGAPGSVQVQPNASVAMSAVASCFDFNATPRNKVVTTALDFPSMGYIWEAQQRLGARVHVVPSDDGIGVPLERILAAIDETTCLVALSHVSYRSSSRVDARALVERAHAQGALVLLDVYQSAGAVELAAADWEVDFMIGGTIKWLCGGPACGYLYVRPALQNELQPRLTGWIAHAEPFAFAHAGMHYASGARRFAQGTPGIPGLHSCLAGLQLIEEVGVPLIAAESRRRTARMVEFMQAKGWPLHSPANVNERGGTVMLGVADGPQMVARLAEHKVFVDCRPGVGLRMSPHFFNTDEEVEAALAVLAEVLGD